MTDREVATMIRSIDLFGSAYLTLDERVLDCGAPPVAGATSSAVTMDDILSISRKLSTIPLPYPEVGVYPGTASEVMAALRAGGVPDRPYLGETVGLDPLRGLCIEEIEDLGVTLIGEARAIEDARRSPAVMSRIRQMAGVKA